MKFKIKNPFAIAAVFLFIINAILNFCSTERNLIVIACHITYAILYLYLGIEIDKGEK